MPRVSIITPCYKAEKFIERTLASVRAQTFQDWEHIVVDDGSPIPLAEILENSLMSDTRLKLLRQSNGGQGNANNTGFAASSPESEYLLFLDADDCLEPEMLSVLVQYLDCHPEVGIAFCDRTYIDENDKILEDKQRPIRRYMPKFLGVKRLNEESADTPFISLFAFSEIIPSASLLRRSIYESTGGWNEQLALFNDTDLWLRFALRSKVHYIPRKLALYRKHPASQTISNSREFWHGQEHIFFTKWLSGEELSPLEQAKVKAAWRFREGCLLPFYRFSWGNDELKKGNFIRAIKYYLMGVKKFGPYIIRRVIELTFNKPILFF